LPSNFGSFAAAMMISYSLLDFESYTE
jgi:hypothetical protein